MNDFSKFINNSIGYLESIINKELKSILIDVGEKTVSKIREYLINWYDEYTPKDYTRTYELLNCVRYSIKGNKVSVIFDYRRLRSIQENNGIGWQAHRSFNGEDFTQGLVEFLEDGSKSGGLGAKTNPRRYDFGTHELQNIQKYIDQYVESEIKRRINVVIREAQHK